MTSSVHAWRRLAAQGCAVWLAGGLALAAAQTPGATVTPAAPSAAAAPPTTPPSAAPASVAALPPNITTQVLDDFRNPGRWDAQASDQVLARVSQDDRGATCLQYDFGRVSGYAVMRRALPLTLPAHYGFTLRLRGRGPANALQFKLVDASGDNVWWRHWPDYTPPAEATNLAIRQRQIEFAWGPTTDRQLRQAAAVELVVASGRGGGAGQVCFEQLALHTLPAPGPKPQPAIAQDDQATTVDLGQTTEINGLQWRWAGPPSAHNATVELSDDGQVWRTVRQLVDSQRSRPLLWLPEQEARFIRIVRNDRSASVADLRWLGPSDWPDAQSLLKAAAATAPRSHFSRAWHGQQNYWTVLGVDGGGANAALIDEDGGIEPRRGGPSLQPLLLDDRGQAIGWDNVQASHSLPQGHLPLPTLQWRHPRAGLLLQVAAEGTPQAARLIARYTVHNPTAQRQKLTLALQLRPWQVNPPQQFLNTAGGLAPVRRLGWQDGRLQVDGQDFAQPLQAPPRVLAAAFDSGDVLGPAGRPLTRLDDPQALASASLQWPLDLAPGQRQTITLALPLVGQLPPLANDADAQARTQAVAQAWQQRLNRVQITLPAATQPLHDSLRTALAHMLMSRDGAALHPGTRSYARSWIRDGAMMVAGLLRLGEVDAARDFVLWYSTQLFADGKVPCCVDARGADPVAENDSHGQFIYAVAELWRHTRDNTLLQRLWPAVDAAAGYMARLADSERQAANPAGLGPGREAFFGMMPASISHEGYSAKPMHSYWDNFWALAGFRDALLIARTLGHGARAEALAAQHQRFRDDLKASLAAAMAHHRIKHLPGAAELGDFDPSSSTLVFSPAGAEALVPRAALQATWQRWWDESRRRGGLGGWPGSTSGASGTASTSGTSGNVGNLGNLGNLGEPADANAVAPVDSTSSQPGVNWAEPASGTWADFTPYELRSVSALLRLGQGDRARSMLGFFFQHQRPAGWRQWAEVVWRQPRQPKFIGDMPHAWVASDYVRSALDLLAYERDSDQALVLAAGVDARWLQDGPVAVQGLRTAHGVLGYSLQRDDDRVLLQVQPGLRPPPGGLWLAWAGRLHRVPAGALTLRLPPA